MTVQKHTVEALAIEYVDAIDNEPNGWGQCCHPVTGEISHGIMGRGHRLFGVEAMKVAIAAEIDGRHEV